MPRRNYWRLWWNDRAGASVIVGGERTELSPDRIVMLAPRTFFSTEVVRQSHHLYVHFQLAAPFDLAVPGLYTVPVTDRLADDLQAAGAVLRQAQHRRILVLARLISGACSALPIRVWQAPRPDARFASVIERMDQHLGEPLSNKQLAALVGMAPTAFVRRFRQVFGISPQAYYLRKRLEHACHLLEHEQVSIDRVAAACGFCDRNYFSTVFRKKQGVSPAAFRKACQAG